MHKYLTLRNYVRRASVALHRAWNTLFVSVNPVARRFGLGRGKPIDRFYIEAFLAANARYIRGTVLEIGDSRYTDQFGTHVAKKEVLHVTEDNPEATIVGDLTQASGLPEGTIDCMVCTQTFNFIYDFKAAIKNSHHILKTGGVLLATVAGISQISQHDMEQWGDYWRFTTLSAQKSFGEVFGEGSVTVDFYGNSLAARSLLNGLSSRELSRSQLEYKDKEYQMLITIVAKKQ